MDYQHKVFNSPSSRRRKVCTPLLWVSTLISTVLLSLLFLNLGGHTVQKPFQSYFCPNPFSVETTFRRYDEFQDISRKGDSHWDSLLTPNGGFVVLDPPSAETYGIAMFHQLHCLQMIRSTMQSLMNPNMSADGQIQHSEHHGANHHANHHANENSHAMHCFDYLRQVRSLAHHATVDDKAKTFCLI